MVGARIVLHAVAVILVEVVMVNGEDVVLNPPGRHDAVVGAVWMLTASRRVGKKYTVNCFFSGGAKGIRTPRSYGGKLLLKSVYGADPPRETTPIHAT
jgi:hypothetical protein